MAVERTLILAKPDAVERSLAGEILARFERRGLEAARGAASCRSSRELGETHYAEHSEKPFFGELVDFITSGADARARARGRRRDRDVPQDDRRDEPGRRRRPARIRGDFALAMPNNLVHGSDSPESAEREIGLWFPDGLV